MQIISTIKELIWQFFSESSSEEPTKESDALPKSMSERTKDYKIRKFEVHEFSSWGKETHQLIIPVSKIDFDSLEPRSNFDPLNMRARILDSDGRSAYLIEVPKFIQKGSLEVYAKAIDYGLIEISKIIEEGDHGDSDGFGVEPDTWIVAYLNLRGEFVSPFSLNYSKSNQNIINQFIAGINPVDENGKIKICPFDKVEKEFRIARYFRVNKGDYWGLADKNLQVVIPLEYKMVHGDLNGLLWVRLTNDLCGTVNLENRFIIPPEYEYLSCIDHGFLKGYYQAVKNGRKGIVDSSNQVISGFDHNLI